MIKVSHILENEKYSKCFNVFNYTKRRVNIHKKISEFNAFEFSQVDVDINIHTNRALF